MRIKSNGLIFIAEKVLGMFALQKFLTFLAKILAEISTSRELMASLVLNNQAPFDSLGNRAFLN